MPVNVISYGVAAIAYGFLALLLLTSWKGRLQGGLLLASVLLSVLWAVMLARQGHFVFPVLTDYFVYDWLRFAGWLLFLLSVQGLLFTWSRHAILLQAVAIVLLAFSLSVNLLSESRADGAFNWASLSMLGLTVCGLFFLEQVFRNTRPERRWAIKYLFFGCGSLFLFDFYFYADAVLFGQIDKNLHTARGFINALAVPLLAVAAARNRQWSLDVFVSRTVVMHTASIMGAGGYLILMALAGYYIREVGGQWGNVALAVFLFFGLVVLMVLLFSDTIRAHLKVFLHKNFFRYKYDHRKEWLKITDALSESTQGPELMQRVILSLARLVDSKGGLLWWDNGRGSYQCVSQWNTVRLNHLEPKEGAVARSLADQDWLVDVLEWRDFPERYQDLDIPEWLQGIERAWLILPLRNHGQLCGFCVLLLPHARQELNWEDRDLLLTAAKQAASQLSLLKASEALAEADRFEAFNRLSAYVVHDLKNQVAQLGLLVSNASKHKQNPQFIDDMIATVENVHGRMTRLLEELRKGRFESHRRDMLDVIALCRTVVQEYEDKKYITEVILPDRPVMIKAEKDRFSAVLGHMLRNAYEASQQGDKVILKIRDHAQCAIIEIIDHGCGMEPEFIQEKLFKPFITTKGNAGMGIGVYETREFIESLGGRVEVESTPGEGSCFRLIVPCAAVANATDMAEGG